MTVRGKASLFNRLAAEKKADVEKKNDKGGLSMKRATAFLIATGVVAMASQAAEIGFIEEFALANDREVTLAKLVPGSQEFYFYSCLVAQQKGDFETAAKLLERWDRFTAPSECGNIKLREKLLEVDPSDAKSLETLANYFRSTFQTKLDHVPRVETPPDSYPASLDGKIDFDSYYKEAIRHDLGALVESEAGFDTIDPAKLTEMGLLDYVSFIRFRPAIPDFWRVILADLRSKHSRGFGAHHVHSLLLLSDFESLAKEMPELLSNPQFVNGYAKRLLPGNPAWTIDPVLKRETLASLRAFAETLPASQNAFKAHVFYHALAADRAAGVFDRALFDAYLRLPRNTHYIRPQWRDSLVASGKWQPADLGSDFTETTGLPPVVNDEPLVRDLLSRLMLEAGDWRPFAEFFTDDYAQTLFAEARFLSGTDDPDSWDARRFQGKYAALRDRVDIDLLPDNPAIYGPETPVVLSVAIKNVSRLTLQVFEIDTFHYFRDNPGVDTAIDLDGLSPTSERTMAFDFPPMRRHEEKIEIPEIKGRGLFVVELIGDTGVSSRAVIRRGRLFAAVRRSSAGTLLSVFDESLAPVPDARAWIAGREFAAGEDGEILVPHIAPDGTSPLASATRALLRDGDFTDTFAFTPLAESYDFDADFLLDHEALVPGECAAVLVTPHLACAGAKIAPSLVESPVFEVSFADSISAGSVRRIPLDRLPDNGAVRLEFIVPEAISRVSMRLSGRVRNIALGRYEDIAAERSLPVDSADSEEYVCDAYLRRTSEGVSIELRGRNGEPFAGRVMNIRFTHRDFNFHNETFTAQTDADGRVTLGRLPPEITAVRVLFDGRTVNWDLSTRAIDLPGELSVAAGERIELPDPAPAGLRTFVSASLYRCNAVGVDVADATSAVSVVDGAVVIEGLEPGDYTLTLSALEGRRKVLLHVYAKPVGGGFASRDDSIAETDAPLLPRIASFDGESDPDKVRIHVANATPATRVHLLSRWSVSDPLPHFAARRFPVAAGSLWPAASLYVSGRALGDEVRYVLERRFAAARPGNLLAKPSLLLRPWDTKPTGSTRVDAQDGRGYDRLSAPEAESLDMLMREGAGGGGGVLPPAPDSPCYGFLPGPALVAENLEPDENGDIAIDRSAFGFRTEVVVLLDDDLSRSAESFALPPAPLQPRERALAATLPLDREVVERTQVTPLAAGESLSFADSRSARYECIDTVGHLYSVLRDFAETGSTASRNLSAFAFVVDWADMGREEKLAAYAKYACHELDLFLYFKDRPFFDEVVAPLVAGVHAPDFLDDWLIGRDLSRWRDPAALPKLNSAEIALLARRSDPSTRDRLAHCLADRAELFRIDRSVLERRFRSILGSDGPAEEDLDLPIPVEGAVFANTMRAGNGAAKALGVTATAAPALNRARALAAAAPAAAAPFVAKSRGGDGRDEFDALASGALVAKRKAARMESDKELRGSAQAFYRSPERTKEWIESRYYRTPRDERPSSVVSPADFWRDAALAAEGAPFLSEALVRMCDSVSHVGFADAMFALALTDLPFKAEGIAVEADGNGGAKLDAKSPMLVVHRQLETLDADSSAALPLLVNETFTDQTQNTTGADGVPRPKVVSGGFVAGRPYAATVTIVNPTDLALSFSLLVQVPQGAIPIGGSMYTRETSLELRPHSDTTFAYFFYFPRPGDFAHYPAHVSDADGASAAAASREFHVAAKEDDADDGSWESVSQRGSDDAVITFLETHNVMRLDLSLVAFRMRDPAMFRRVTDLLRARGRFDSTVWNYAFLHKDAATMPEAIALILGGTPPWPWIDSPLYKFDAVAEGRIEHAEYWPLVNARAHALGGKRRILDETFAATYAEFLRYLAFKPAPDDSDRLALAVYLLLQDRVEDAAKQLAAIDPGKIGEKMQYDYLRAYMAFCEADPEAARKIAAPYASHPVERWRKLFGDVVAQADEIKNGAKPDDDKDSATSYPSLALEEDGDGIAIHYSGLESCVVKYYPMDLELLFSRSPFAGDVGERFAMVRPTKTETVRLPKGGTVAKRKIADDFRARNVRIEVEGEGATAGIVHTPHTLAVRVSEAAGQLVATDAKGKPIPAAYVKAYARWKDGRVLFYKDGYTDLRGRFDYASLSTDDLPQIERFAILVITPANGALVREAAPPNR